MVRRHAAVVALSFATLVAIDTSRPLAQEGQTPPVFRTGVDVVQLDVSVLDEHRQPVRGLTAADFTVLERGQPQPIVSFAAVDLPPRPVDAAPWVAEIAPDVTANHHDAQRVVVIFFDDFHVPFDAGVSARAKTIGRAVVDGLGPSDLAAVVYAVGRRQGQEFTTDRARLREAVDRFTPTGMANRGTTHAFSAGLPPRSFMMGESGACVRASCIQQAMRQTSEMLRAAPGSRKTFVFISSYTPVFEADRIETVGDLGDWQVVLRAMQEANLTVYQFDPRGLEVSSDITQTLGSFADATGGRTVAHTNAPEAAVPQMFRENGSYYLLGVQPTTLVRNGRFRPIDVRVDRPGVTVRTRAGYFPPRDIPSPRPSNRPGPSVAERAVAAPLPAGEIPMRLAVSARPGGQRPRSHAVDITVGFTPIGLAADGEDVDVLIVAFRNDWREAARATHRVQLTPGRTTGGPPNADIAQRLDLAPGRYEIRAAVTRPRTGLMGSAFASITVPDFPREPISLSGVSIVRTPIDTDATPQATTVRTFTAADAVVATLSAHQGGRDVPVDVDVELRVVDTDGRTRSARRVALAASAFGSARSADVRFDLPLASLEPGEYLATVEATASRGRAVRHVRLHVR